MPPLVLGLLFWLGLLLLSASLGRRLLRAMRVPPCAFAEHALIGTTLGLGALQAVPFVLFSLGAGTPAVFRAVTVCVALALVPDMVDASRSARAWARGLGRPRGWEVLLLAAGAVLAALVFLQALRPPTDADGLSYHLAAAVRYLAAARFTYLPTLTYTNWPVGVESLFAYLLAMHPLAPVCLVPYTFGLLAVGMVYLWARRIGGSVAGAAAAGILMLYTPGLAQMRAAHVDIATASLAIAGALALALAREERNAGRWRLLAGVLGGLAATTKLNGVWVPVALAAVVLLDARSGATAGERAERALAVTLAGFCVAAPWFARTWVLTGNPVYPFVYGIFGGREWTADGTPRLQYYFLRLNTPPGIAPTWAALMAARLAMAAVAVGLAYLAVRATRASPLGVPLRFAGVFGAGLLLTSGYNIRFLAPGVVCLAVCLGAWAGRRLGSRPWVAAAGALVLAAGFARSSVADLRTTLSVATGAMARDAYLLRCLPDYPVVQFANTHLPPDARVLVATWDESTALYRVPALRANYWMQDSLHYDLPGRLVSDLGRLGVTHLVFQPMDPTWCGRSAVCAERDRTETRALAALAAASGRPMFSANGVSLYRLSLTGNP